MKSIKVNIQISDYYLGHDVDRVLDVEDEIASI